MEESKVSEESRIYINWEETNGVTGGGQLHGATTGLNL